MGVPTRGYQQPQGASRRAKKSHQELQHHEGRDTRSYKDPSGRIPPLSPQVAAPLSPPGRPRFLPGLGVFLTTSAALVGPSQKGVSNHCACGRFPQLSRDVQQHWRTGAASGTIQARRCVRNTACESGAETYVRFVSTQPCFSRIRLLPFVLPLLCSWTPSSGTASYRELLPPAP